VSRELSRYGIAAYVVVVFVVAMIVEMAW